MTTFREFMFSTYGDDSVCGDAAKPTPCVVSFFDRPVRHEKLIAFLPDQRTLTVQENGKAALNRQRELREQRIGGLLVEQRAVSVSELERAIRTQSAQPIKKLAKCW